MQREEELRVKTYKYRGGVKDWHIDDVINLGYIYAIH